MLVVVHTSDDARTVKPADDAPPRRKKRMSTATPIDVITLGDFGGNLGKGTVQHYFLKMYFIHFKMFMILIFTIFHQNKINDNNISKNSETYSI